MRWFLGKEGYYTRVKTRKHVIFLGAGASKGSGYPLANELRLLISSRQHFEKAITEYEIKHRLTGHPIWTDAKACLDQRSATLDLFRNGGFATIDEFCKLARGFKLPENINGLRCLVRAALGLFNPEEDFHLSEYYGFVQSLFREDLVTLREDITILNYNYDPYLEFLLHRALQHRWRIVGEGRNHHALNSVTSGFHLPNNHEWLNREKSEAGFCSLKLHGSICYFNQDDPFNHETLFQDGAARRVSLFQHLGKTHVPPILFPWEIIGENGFIEQGAFPISYDASLYPLLIGIWKRARDEVQTAEKISFVGLSMHSFILDGLKYLFEGKTGEVRIVVANPDNTPFIPGQGETHWCRLPHSPGFLVSDALGKIAPNLKKHRDEVTLVKDFAAFIKTEMKPFTR